MQSIVDADVKNKRVFLRVDFNVPMQNGEITDNTRLKAALPTIKLLIEKRAKIIIGTHLGKPKGRKVPELSTKSIAQALSILLDRQIEVIEAIVGLEAETKINTMEPGSVVLLENLRWNPGEEQNSEEFAQALARLADLYCNDAFAVCHRAAASIEAITKYLPSYSGLRLESETTTLKLLLGQPVSPFILIIGGAKIKDKIGVIQYLGSRVDQIFLGGAVANSFLAAQGYNIDQSLADPEVAVECGKLLEMFGNKISLPCDGVKENLADGRFRIMDIGPETVRNYTKEVLKAKSIFWNGNMGYTEDRRYTNGTRSIARSIADNENTTVVAGGDTVGFLSSNNLLERFSFVSTGGGAALKFLAGEKLPGIKALEKAKNEGASSTSII